MRQEVLSRNRTSVDFFTGTRQGLLAVFTTFTASGIHHIAIGPDHILFIIGLLLLGGSLTRLLAIVTAFTLGHSVTLALATLADRRSAVPHHRAGHRLEHRLRGRRQPADRHEGTRRPRVGGVDVRSRARLRVRERAARTGLPNRALGMSLFSFNLGVEIGQAIIVVIVATALSLVRRRDPVLARRIATAGSVAVMIAGAFWFIQRVF